MTSHSKDQLAIITLLTEIYLEVVVIEQQFKLIAGAGDMRPRIDYFHDAIRAFTDGGIDHPRLSVELLSYDLRCLQYIQRMPLSPFREAGGDFSPSQEIMNTDVGIIATGDRPDRKIRTRISELYQHYAVMFSALLKPAADHDYQDRTSNLDNDIGSIQAIIDELQTKIDVKAISRLSQKLEEMELRIILATFIEQKKHKNSNDVKKLLGHLNKLVKQKDAQINSVAKAHLGFASAQLNIFEESKDMLKKLATQGMNLVGKFVEASVASTRKQMGR